jgi:DNA replication and repair protein RecF
VLRGDNGQGKTSVLEAVGWIARGKSFRGVVDAQLVRAGSDRAIVRAEVTAGARVQLFEAEIKIAGRNRVLHNRQPVARTRDLSELLRVTVFAPDDLSLVKDGPAARRTYLDELLGMLAARYDAARVDYERVLKQRNALLRSGMRAEHAHATLAVFDEQLVAAGAELVRGRLRLVGRLRPAVESAYRSLASGTAAVGMRYDAEWSEQALTVTDADDLAALLGEGIARRRSAEVERGTTLVGPHRDELRLEIDGLEARTQASQGEQRTLALALRLGGHHVVSEIAGAAPVLLLDDVFSELDATRAAALVENLPRGQTLLTTASTVPAGIEPERQLRVAGGRVHEDDT